MGAPGPPGGRFEHARAERGEHPRRGEPGAGAVAFAASIASRNAAMVATGALHGLPTSSATYLAPTPPEQEAGGEGLGEGAFGAGEGGGLVAG
ncbi:MAG TPA: hypothetical protein VKZ81_03040, partial [Pseudonocardia sp.]|uniref:hypothetical protein n=1 Tax=Pseudonocardia sp. TaxID=60912 RepID=UPI002B4B6A6D